MRGHALFATGGLARYATVMSLYRRHIFPRLCHLALRDERTMERRRRVLSGATGEVVEIGFGSGLNLSCYPHRVSRIVAVEPNPGMRQLAERRVHSSAVPVEVIAGSAESLPFASGSFDTVVSTFTLCSLADPETVLTELRRVLRPGGQFVFLEHGLSPDTGVARWQTRLTPFQKRLGDGCTLDRKIDAMISGSGFTFERLETGYQPGGPKVASYLYEGAARPG